MINTTVYKTKPILTGLRHGKIVLVIDTAILSALEPLGDVDVIFESKKLSGLKSISRDNMQ